MKTTKRPMDRQRKQPTNAQRQDEELKNFYHQKLQESYFKGIKFGSHMQCSTILEIYKARLEETPKKEITKDFLKNLLNEVFTFCENGCTQELDFSQFSRSEI